MDRHTVVKQDCIGEVQSMTAQIDAILNRKETYLDPDHAIQPTTGLNLWERYDNMSARIVREFPEYAPSIPARKQPPDSEQSLDREDLKSFARDITALLSLLSSRTR